MLTLGFFFSVNRTLADETELFGAKEASVEKQVFEVSNSIVGTEGWEPSTLQTYSTKFLIRGKEALTWSLNIEDGGFHDESIKTSYVKVLTIVNSLFILGLLAIAAMWMFSIIIPRRYLKQVILIYAGAVIFINFALPLNQLFIDGTNLLQKTLLMQEGKSIGITEIVETPDYEEVVGYQNNNGAVLKNTESEMEIELKSAAGDLAIGQVGNEPADETSPDQIVLNANQPLTITQKQESKFQQYNEHAIFNFLMIGGTGLAYFMLALIFVLRIVILWALLILSPVLFMLAIFKSTRGWFWNWLGIYGRWLLIGPLAALGIAVIVNIWQTVGLPITNSYAGQTFANNLTNVAFYLPGKTVANTLSNTGEMMEYLVFLLMLYVPIFFAFALTRQKVLRGVADVVVERVRQRRVQTEIHTEETREESVRQQQGMISGVKNFINSKIATITQTAMPAEIRETGRKMSPIPSASSFLPEQLSATSLHNMLELVGAKKESRHSREQALEKLASPETIKNAKERERMSSVRNEIEKRARGGDPEAMMLMSEIQNKISPAGNSVKAIGEVSAETHATAHAEVETKPSSAMSGEVKNTDVINTKEKHVEKEMIATKKEKNIPHDKGVEKFNNKKDKKEKTEKEQKENNPSDKEDKGVQKQKEEKKEREPALSIKNE